MGYKESVCVTNFYPDHCINILYPAKSIIKFTTVLHLFLMKGIFFQLNFINEILLIFVVHTKGVSTFLNFPDGNHFLPSPRCDQSYKY